MSAVDGPIVAGDFGEPHTDGACDHEGQCVLLAVWSHAGDHMRKLLDSYRLSDIASMAQGNENLAQLRLLVRAHLSPAG